MQSFDLMKLGKPNTSIIQNLCFMQDAPGKQQDACNSEEDTHSIFANSPIVDCEVTGKKSSNNSGSGNNSAQTTPLSGLPSGGSGGETSKQQTFESVMKSKGH